MSAHNLRHMTWKYHHPNATPRTMQNPQAWIGKAIPADIDPASITFDFCECDHCDKAFASIDDLHTFMCPEWNQRWAWDLLRGLGHDAAEMFCEDCYTKLSWQAEKIVPNWHHYYCEGYMELPETPEQESPDYVEAWLRPSLDKAFAVAACEVGDEPASYEAPVVEDVTAATPAICPDCNGTGWIDIDEFEAVSCTCGASGYPAEPKTILVDVDETFAAVPVGEYEGGFSTHSDDLGTAMIDLGDKRGMSDQDFYDTLSRWKANLDSVVDDDVNLVSAPISDEPKHEEVAAALELIGKWTPAPFPPSGKEHVNSDQPAMNFATRAHDQDHRYEELFSAVTTFVTAWENYVELIPRDIESYFRFDIERLRKLTE